MTRRRLYQVVYVGPHEADVDRDFETRLWSSARVARRYGTRQMPPVFRHHWSRPEKRHVRSYAVVPILVDTTAFPRLLIKNLLHQARLWDVRWEWLAAAISLAVLTGIAAALTGAYLPTTVLAVTLTGTVLALGCAVVAVAPLLRDTWWNARFEAAHEFWRIEADVRQAHRLDGGPALHGSGTEGE